MKINNFRDLRNNKFIKLKTLKLKIKQIETQRVLLQTNFLKIYNIIYQYQLLDKKILFLGFPVYFKNTLRTFKHQIITESLLFNGIFSNKESKDNILKTKNIDLVIILNKNHNFNIEKESYVTRIPIISLKEKQKFMNKTTYQFLNSNKSLKTNKMIHNFVLSCIGNSLMRAKQNRDSLEIQIPYYISYLQNCSKKEKISFLSKLHQKYGLSILYKLKKYDI